MPLFDEYATAAYRVEAVDGSCTTSVTHPVSTGAHVAPLLLDLSSPRQFAAKFLVVALHTFLIAVVIVVVMILFLRQAWG